MKSIFMTVIILCVSVPSFADLGLYLAVERSERRAELKDEICTQMATENSVGIEAFERARQNCLKNIIIEPFENLEGPEIPFRIWPSQNTIIFFEEPKSAD